MSELVLAVGWLVFAVVVIAGLRWLGRRREAKMSAAELEQHRARVRVMNNRTNLVFAAFFALNAASALFAAVAASTDEAWPVVPWFGLLAVGFVAASVYCAQRFRTLRHG